jgi:hypothetical protein
MAATKRFSFHVVALTLLQATCIWAEVPERVEEASSYPTVPVQPPIRINVTPGSLPGLRWVPSSTNSSAADPLPTGNLFRAPSMPATASTPAVLPEPLSNSPPAAIDRIWIIPMVDIADSAKQEALGIIDPDTVKPILIPLDKPPAGEPALGIIDPDMAKPVLIPLDKLPPAKQEALVLIDPDMAKPVLIRLDKLPPAKQEALVLIDPDMAKPVLVSPDQPPAKEPALVIIDPDAAKPILNPLDNQLPSTYEPKTPAIPIAAKGAANGAPASNVPPLTGNPSPYNPSQR